MLIYIISGGFVAVVWSDVFQGTLMVVGLVLLPLFGLAMIGGYSPAIESLRLQEPTLLSAWGPDGVSWKSVFTIISFLAIGLGFMGSPQIFVRFLSLRSVDEIRPGALAAIMSTVDSLLVLASSAFVRDFYQKVLHPELADNQMLSRSRIVTFILAALALAIAFSVAWLVPGRTVFWFVIFGWSGISATFCPTMILSLYWSRLTSWGALAGMLTGFVSVPFYKFVATQVPVIGDSIATLGELPLAFVSSGLVAIVISLLDQKGAMVVDDDGKEIDLNRL